MKTSTAMDGFPLPPCARMLGWRLLEARRENGWVRVGFEAKPDFCNPAGTVQGGFLAAMLDDTMGPAVVVKSDGAYYPATIDMNLSFLAPARPGRLIAEASAIQLGKTIGFLEGRLFDPEGALLVRATATARIVALTKAVARS